MSLSGEISKNIVETDCYTKHSDIALKSGDTTVKMDFIFIIILTVQNCSILNRNLLKPNALARIRTLKQHILKVT
jgi:hypothetical protein